MDSPKHGFAPLTLGHKNVILVKFQTSHPWTHIKLSNFQVSYHFGKLLSSWFQNFCLFCNIVTKEHFTDHFGKLFSSWFQNFCPFCNILTEGHFTDHWNQRNIFFWSPFISQNVILVKSRTSHPWTLPLDTCFHNVIGILINYLCSSSLFYY